VPELSVQDLDASLTFYVEGVGFTVAFTRAEPAFAYLDLDGAQLMLEQDHPDAWVVAPAAYPRGRGINLQVEVADVTRARQRLHALGVIPFRDIRDHWYDTADGPEGQAEFLVTDPDGYLIRLFEVLSDEPRHHGW